LNGGTVESAGKEVPNTNGARPSSAAARDVEVSVEGSENQTIGESAAIGDGRAPAEHQAQNAKEPAIYNLQPVTGKANIQQPTLINREQASNIQHPVTDSHAQPVTCNVQPATPKPRLTPEEAERAIKESIADLTHKADSVGLVALGVRSYEWAALRAYITQEPAPWYDQRKGKVVMLEPPSIDPRCDPNLRWYEITQKWERMQERDRQRAIANSPHPVTDAHAHRTDLLSYEAATQVVEAAYLDAKKRGFRVPKAVEVAALRAHLTGRPVRWYDTKTSRRETMPPPAMDPRLDPASPWHALWKLLERN
jgi:hypothetical protein